MNPAPGPCFSPGKKLDPAIVARLVKGGEYQTTSSDGRLVTTYQHDASQDEAAKDDPIVKRLVINEITYDVSLCARGRCPGFLEMLAANARVVASCLSIYIVASRLLQRQLLDPLFKLRSQARAIADGDLEQSIADTGRRDEIGNLATSFASMRDAVRRTILDLRETNTSIERFVPKPFLTIMGKPSIVSVKLGDNRRLRHDGTVLRHPQFHRSLRADDARREFRLHQLLSRAHGAGHSRQ